MKYEGTKFINAGIELIIPALSIHQAREKKEQVAAFYDRAARVADQSFRVTDLAEDLPLIHLAICRNYPIFSLVDVEDFVDFNNYNDIMAAILGTGKKEHRLAAEVTNPK